MLPKGVLILAYIRIGFSFVTAEKDWATFCPRSLGHTELIQLSFSELGPYEAIGRPETGSVVNYNSSLSPKSIEDPYTVKTLGLL